MQPAIDYSEVCWSLKSAFEYRYNNHPRNKARMTGLLFARPTSSIAKDEIVPNIGDFHHRSGNHIDFFLAGYTYGPGNQSIEDYSSVRDAEGWLYSGQRFQHFREEIESRTQWKYSGACDLLLANARYDESERKAYIDFRTTIVCRLDRMKADKAIDDVETFFESIFRFSESATGDDPTWGFSDAQGVATAGSALKRFILSLLPKNLGKEFARAQHFAVQDVGI